MPQLDFLETVQRVVKEAREHGMSTSGEASAEYLTKQICAELRATGARLVPAPSPIIGRTFALGVVVFPTGAIFRVLRGAGADNVPTWELESMPSNEALAARERALPLNGAGDRVFAATEQSAILEKLERLEAYAREHRAHLERLMRVVVETSSPLRRPVNVRLFGLRFSVEVVEDRSAELRVKIGKTRAS